MNPICPLCKAKLAAVAFVNHRHYDSPIPKFIFTCGTTTEDGIVTLYSPTCKTNQIDLLTSQLKTLDNQLNETNRKLTNAISLLDSLQILPLYSWQPPEAWETMTTQQRFTQWQIDLAIQKENT